ncbi:TonB-dependent receptor [Novosphingobium sp. Gsoil 351]|uniref:TonB-dependent receptor n=1 Tax=Novosphingobium sp. Gsoil 351 TaxID=2675225 RepID=UPI0012B45E92|nr:TonB-dependent receptor [Novosphingobium sp. Gsoil 351]QGN55817.1 TonB-dependent receptor [Novosphingobium sp. Gsoil 351]
MASRQRAIFPNSWALRSSLALTAIVCASPNVEAREAARLDIAASDLPQAIAELARQAGVSIGSNTSLPAIRTQRIRGTIGVAEALRRLLGPAGLVARQVGSTAWRIERSAQAVRPSPTPPPTPSALAPEVQAPPIVVTAAKQEQSLASAPFAVAVVVPDERSGGLAQAVLGSTWLASNVEGLALTGLGPGRNRMFVRGVADSPFNGASQSTVAILLDEARLTYAAPDPDVRLVDVERVELLKGPQGSLYGTGALGGIYQIRTRRPDLDSASFAAETGAENVWHGGLGGSASAVVNLPLRRDRMALRVLGYGAVEPGWIDTGDRRDANETRLWGARATLRTALGDAWLADATGFVQFLNSRDTQYVYAPTERARPAQLPEPHDNDLRHAALRVERRGGQIGIHLTSAMTWHDVADKLDATVGAQGFGLPDPGRLNDARSYRVWDNEARLDGQWGGMRWLAGAAYLDATQSRDLLLNARASTATISLGTEKRNSSDAALFGQMSMPLGQGLEATVGGRLFRSSTELTRAGRASAGLDDRRRTNVTPSASLSWQPRDGRLFFVRYGSAFRQGGLGAGSAQPMVLEGDELRTIEAGWREMLGSRGQFDLGGYFSDWDHLQSDALGTDGLVGTVDAGRARIVGAEASVDFRPVVGWRLQAGAIFQSALLIRNDLGIELDDRRLPVVPRYTVRGSLSHDWMLGPIPFSAQADARYLGPARLSFDPVLDRRAGNLLETRLFLGARLGRLALGVVTSNPLGLEANTFALGNPLRVIASRQYIPQKPRSIALSVRLLEFP